MSSPFGPGEIVVFPINPSTNVRGLSAALENFGIDQSGLKNEHKKWLDDNVVPAMKSDPATRVFLRGSASKSGANDYNMRLSERRVESVRKHLGQRGVSSGQISSTFTGEELALGSTNESASDRAVFLFLLLGRVAATRFREFTQFTGFDDSAVNKPPWQMVPFMSRVLVRLVGDNDSLSLVCVNPVTGLPSIKVEATRITAGLISLLGLFPGKAQIQARDTFGNVLARLDVSVKFHREFSIAFHRVRDSAQPPNQTRRTDGEILNMFGELNEIYEPQANIKFTLPRLIVNQVTINRNLGRAVTWLNQPGDEGSQVIANRDPSAKLNVFLVWEVQAGPSGPGDLDQGEAASMLVTGKPQTQPFLNKIGCDVLIDDDVTLNEKIGIVLAHEAGHFLLGCQESDHNRTVSAVMFPGIRNAGRKIFRLDADRMNPDLIP